MNKTQDEDIVDKLEEIGSKSIKLIEQIFTNNSPKINKLLSAFGNWLDSKLEPTK